MVTSTTPHKMCIFVNGFCIKDMKNCLYVKYVQYYEQQAGLICADCGSAAQYLSLTGLVLSGSSANRFFQ